MSSTDAVIETPRLILRHWRPGDREPFAHLNGDSNVMRYYPSALSREESNSLADRIERHFAAHRFGLYAAEFRESAQFIGYVGLSVPRFEAHFTPCVEIGWRLAADHWNCGLATEGARAVIHYAFEELRLASLVAFTPVENAPSRRVMEKLGMSHDPAGDFDHPGLPPGHWLSRHVLYRLEPRDFV